MKRIVFERHIQPSIFAVIESELEFEREEKYRTNHNMRRLSSGWLDWNCEINDLPENSYIILEGYKPDMKYHLLFEHGQYGGYFSTLSDLLDVLFEYFSNSNKISNFYSEKEFTILITQPSKEELLVLTNDKVCMSTDRAELAASLRERMFQILYSEVQ